MKKRNINIDLIKCIAVFSVISVHYFANVGLYKTIIEENKMYIGIVFRTLFMICVPLFIITTGYLMKNKMLSKKILSRSIQSNNYLYIKYIAIFSIQFHL